LRQQTGDAGDVRVRHGEQGVGRGLVLARVIGLRLLPAVELRGMQVIAKRKA